MRIVPHGSVRHTSSRLTSLTSCSRLPTQWKELGGLYDDRRVVSTAYETATVLISCSVDIMVFINDNPPPATVILISGDRDFAYLLSTVRWRKYNVILISNTSMTHKSLTSQASVVYDWNSDIFKARPPSTESPLLRSQSLHPAASLTTPQNPDIIPEPGAPAGPANQHVPLATQPSILSPRPPNMPVIDPIHTTRVTLPQDSPSVELEVTPIPEKAGIPIRTASTDIPVEPTPDDRAVAGLAGGPTTVHLIIS